MKIDDSIFWLGTEASLRSVVDAQIEFRGRTLNEEEDEPDQSRLLTVSDGIATIMVQGPLTNSDSFWNQFFGITSYNEIRNAIIEAIEDEDVDRILLDMDTPGGAAKGVDELSDFIKTAKQHKPIDTYVSGSAFSAGYWIASATDKIYGPKMSEAGSIGVIAILMNHSAAMKKEGYEVTIFRGGKYKALGNPYEKLTDTAKKIFQAKIDVMEGFFLDVVSTNRGIPRHAVKSQVGEGLTFFAADAVANGLMDEMVSFDTLFNRLVKQSNYGSAGGRTILSEDIDMKKKVLTAESVAALASGAQPESVESLLVEGVDTAAGETVAAAEEAPAEEAAPAEAAAAAEEEAPAEEAAPAEQAAAPETASLVAYLKDEVATLRAANTAMTAELEGLRTSASTALANEGALKKLANEYVAGMSVGLGMSAMDLSGMETSVLLTQYTEVRSKFTSRFKVGASAEVEDDEMPASSGDGLSHMERASIAANKI